MKQKAVYFIAIAFLLLLTTSGMSKKSGRKTHDLANRTIEVTQKFVYSATTGKVVKVNFKEGDFVKEGTVLVELDDADKKKAFEEAKLNYDEFKKVYERYQDMIKDKDLSDAQMYNMNLSCENAQKELRKAKEEWESTRIVAPGDGVIASKSIKSGMNIYAGNVIAEYRSSRE